MFLRETKTKYRSVYNECNKAEQEHFSQKRFKCTGECFSTKLKSTCKNAGTFEGKKFTWKSHLRQSCTKPFNFTFMYMTLFLAQSILQFWNETFYYTITVIPIQTFQIMTWMLSKLDIYHQKIHANISLIRNYYILKLLFTTNLL